MQNGRGEETRGGNGAVELSEFLVELGFSRDCALSKTGGVAEEIYDTRLKTIRLG